MAKKKLNLPRIAPSAEAPFAEDKIGRQPLAERITQVLEDAEDAVVLAVDGGWGTGKSTFARMLQAHLDGRGFRTAYIDAFAVDYVEDPFVPIFARLQALINQEKDAFDKSQDFLKKAARVAGTLLSKAGSAAVNMAVQAGMLSLTGVPLLGAEKLGEKAAESWEELSARRIMGFLEEERYIEEYKAALTATAQAYYEQHDKPLVIFIDELDRCRPDFAVLFLERIKHFFEVPNIAFVLIIHRDQLEKSIRGCYGAEIDARTYLQKFISLNYQIDQAVTIKEFRGLSDDTPQGIDLLIEDIFRKCGFDDHDKLSSMIRLIREFEVSFRELEKIYAILKSAPRALEKESLLLKMLLLLVVLQMKNPQSFGESMANENFGKALNYHNPLFQLLRSKNKWNTSSALATIESLNRIRDTENKTYRDYWQWARMTLTP